MVSDFDWRKEVDGWTELHQVYARVADMDRNRDYPFITGWQKLSGHNLMVSLHKRGKVCVPQLSLEDWEGAIARRQADSIADQPETRDFDLTYIGRQLLLSACSANRKKPASNGKPFVIRGFVATDEHWELVEKDRLPTDSDREYLTKSSTRNMVVNISAGHPSHLATRVLVYRCAESKDGEIFPTDIQIPLSVFLYAYQNAEVLLDLTQKGVERLERDYKNRAGVFKNYPYPTAEKPSLFR